MSSTCTESLNVSNTKEQFTSINIGCLNSTTASLSCCIFSLNLECRFLVVKINKVFYLCVIISLFLLLKLSTLYVLQTEVISL